MVNKYLILLPTQLHLSPMKLGIEFLLLLKEERPKVTKQFISLSPGCGRVCGFKLPQSAFFRN